MPYSSSSLVCGADEAADEPVAVGANVKAADPELDPKLKPLELAGFDPIKNI